MIDPCIATAVYGRVPKQVTFVTAYDKAVMRQMKRPPGRVLEQFYVESHISIFLI